jgi:hypothetical protein
LKCTRPAGIANGVVVTQRFATAGDISSDIELAKSENDGKQTKKPENVEGATPDFRNVVQNRAVFREFTDADSRTPTLSATL